MADDVTPISAAASATGSPPAPPADLAPIRALVARARTRLRLQGALEGATTASILASAGALTAVFAVRTELIAPATGIGFLAAAGGVIGVGAVLGALGHLDDEQVARRIDRASGLADRLSSAVAFERVLAGPGGAAAGADDDETVALMQAAMRDAAAIVPRADVRAATPMRRPADLPIALAFAAIAAVAASLGVVLPDLAPRVVAAQPGMGRRGAAVAIEGQRLCGPKAAATVACAPASAMVYLGDAAATDPNGAIAAPIDRWTGGAVFITVPAAAKVGPTELVVWANGKRIGAVGFEILDDKDPRAGQPNTVALDPDDQAYLRDLVADLRDTAKRDNVKELDDYAAKVEQLLDLADNGELTKEQLLEAMQQAQDELNEKMERTPEQIQQDLADTGEELKKNELTKELGAALEKGDLEKAKAEMEKLAAKLDKGELNQEQTQELAKTLDQAAKQYEQKQDQKQQEAKRDQQKVEEQVRKLEKERDQAKTPEERDDADRRLDKKKDELAKLQKKQEEQDGSKQREALKRLHKDLDKAAKSLEQKPEPGEDKGQQQQDNQKQASRSMKDVADETGKVDQDQRKQAAQKKVASQMEDLREAMRRAKQQGKPGPGNPFGKNGKRPGQGLDKQAGQGQKGQGQKGQGQGDKGQGQGDKGQGQGENGGDGKDPNGPSNTYGDGHDNNLVGDATDTSGNTSDESVSGAQGRKGPSRRETILAAAQKGYASKAYKQVFADYKSIVEEVMRAEKVPPSYRYYVKKYFTKIKPHAMD